MLGVLCNTEGKKSDIEDGCHKGSYKAGNHIDHVIVKESDSSLVLSGFTTMFSFLSLLVTDITPPHALDGCTKEGINSASSYPTYQSDN